MYWALEWYSLDNAASSPRACSRETRGKTLLNRGVITAYKALATEVAST